MKAAFALLFALLTSFTLAGDALILISPEGARSVGTHHAEWILWPPLRKPASVNRLLSLLTATDWEGTGDELVFGRNEDAYRSVAFPKLRSIGYFLARQEVVTSPSFAVELGGGLASPAAVLLAMNGRSPVTTPLSMSDAWPSGGLAVAEVEDWDKVAAIARKVKGKTLVIEYPPPPGRRWSRFWMRGSGWGDRLPIWRTWKVPGLIPASQAGNLLLHPEKFEWTENDSGNWGGADRWLAFVAYSAPLTLAVLAFITTFFAGCTVYLIAREERAKFGAVTLKYLTLLPAAILLASHLTRAAPDLLPLWVVLGFFALVVAAQALGGLAHRLLPRAHYMFPIILVGFLATAASAPLWSMYSNVFGINVLPLAPEAAGAFFAYLVGVCAFARGAVQAVWLARTLAVGVLAWGLLFDPWWVSGQITFALFPLVAVAIGEKLFRVWMLPVLALVPIVEGHITRGVCWAPGNLFATYAQRDALNLARHVEFLVSLGFLGTALSIGVLAIFVERFFFHEIRRTFLRDTRTRALFQASAACAVFGILQPLMLYSALVCFVGGLFVLLSDTARAL